MKKALCITLVYAILMTLIAVAPFSANANEKNTIELSGTIREDMLLNDTDCNYVLSGNINIAYDVTLELADGVTLNGNGYEINVYGTLLAKDSTIDNALIYSRNKDKGKESSYSTITIERSHINQGRFLYPTGNSSHCKLSLIGNTFSGIGGYMYIWYPEQETHIEGNIFDNCGKMSVGSDYNVYVRYNTFVNYKNIIIEDWAAYNESDCYFEYNNIYVAGIDGIVGLKPDYNSSSMTAQHNYWNTNNTSIISSYIMDENLDYSCAGEVPYLPIEQEPVPVKVIALNLNGGNCNTSTQIGVVGIPYGNLPRPTHNTLSFGGWYTGLSDGELITNSTPVSNNHNTLYAHWTGSSSEPTTSEPTVTPTQAPTEPESTPIKGDIDGDGEVTIIDTTYMQRHLAGLAMPDFGIGEPIES